MKSEESPKDNEDTNKKINNLVNNITQSIRGNNRGWLGKIGICEVCKFHKAEVNLDLKYGSHRECRFCWND